MKNVYLDLYKKLGVNVENTVFSPHSFLAVLLMAAEGAKNTSEIKNNLGITDKFKFPVAFNNIRQNKLFSSSSAWHDNFFDLSPWNEVFEKFNAEIYKDDFNSLECSGRINHWVDAKTSGKINRIIGDTDSAFPLVLLNAIYFKGLWLKTFPKKNTTPCKFYNRSGSVMEVPTMRSHEEYKYVISPSFQAVEIPYKNNELSMIVIMPSKISNSPDTDYGLKGSMYIQSNCQLCLNEFNMVLGNGQKVSLPINNPAEEKILRDLELRRFITVLGVSEKSKVIRVSNKAAVEDVDIEMALNRLENGDKSKIMLYLPKFKIESDFDLTNIVSSLGIRKAFNLDAYRTLQKAIIEVDEVGTEAAAVTAMVFKCAASAEQTIRIDHPFTFLIKENKTKSIVFMGSVNNL